MNPSIVLVLLGGLVMFSPAAALAQPGDHSGHKSPPGHTACAECDINSKHDRIERPYEFGQDILSAMQEMVMMLEGKTDTDWTKFNLQGLYVHLVDMSEIAQNTTITTQDLDDGLAFTLTGNPRTLEALKRAIPEHAITFGQINGWDSKVEVEPTQVALFVTSTSAEEVLHIKGLGFTGLMTTGAGHHQPFHLALARGETTGGWPRAEYITNAADDMNQSLHGMKQGAHMGAGMPHTYAGMQDREIKALSQDRIEWLSSGKGIGNALAAELNHYPGPRHVLDMAQDLGLSDKQQDDVRTLFEKMQSDAIALGKEIIENEAKLDRAFADKKIDQVSLEAMVGDIAALEGRLRTVHLSTHLDVQRILSPHQIALYDQMRGYTSDAGNAMNHRMP